MFDEISWTIDDGEGNQISDGDTSVTDGGVANCGADEEPPTACAHTFNMTDSFGDGWNGAAVNILVNGTTILRLIKKNVMFVVILKIFTLIHLKQTTQWESFRRNEK